MAAAKSLPLPPSSRTGAQIGIVEWSAVSSLKTGREREGCFYPVTLFAQAPAAPTAVAVATMDSAETDRFFCTEKVSWQHLLYQVR